MLQLILSLTCRRFAFERLICAATSRRVRIPTFRHSLTIDLPTSPAYPTQAHPTCISVQNSMASNCFATCRSRSNPSACVVQIRVAQQEMFRRRNDSVMGSKVEWVTEQQFEWPPDVNELQANEGKTERNELRDNKHRHHICCRELPRLRHRNRTNRHYPSGTDGELVKLLTAHSP